MNYKAYSNPEMVPHVIEEMRLHITPVTEPGEDINSRRIYKNMLSVLGRTQIVMPPQPYSDSTELIIRGRKGGLRAIGQVSTTGALAEYLVRIDRVLPRVNMSKTLIANAPAYQLEQNLMLPEVGL